MIVAAGILLISPEGRILLLRRSDEGDAAGLWAFPGGKIEEGEDAEKAVVRECFEETGYRLGTAGLMLMRRIKDGVDFITFVKKIDDEFIPKLNGEHTAFAWVFPSDVLPAPVSAPLNQTAGVSLS